MSNYELMSFGAMKEQINGFSFFTHPAGSGPLNEFTSGLILPDRAKILFPGNLCFDEKLSNHDVFYDNLASNPSRWELYFNFETKMPLIRIYIPPLDLEFIVALSQDNSWFARYGSIHSRYDNLEKFELREWFVPVDLKGKVISVVSHEAFGKQYC